MTKLLFVVTGAHEWTLADGSKHPTGFWAEELVTPHRAFTEAGWDITIAVPGGRTPRADDNSLAAQFNGGDQSVVDDLVAALGTLAPTLAAATPLEDIDPDEYDALFVPGGHGPMEDLAVSPAMGDILIRMLDAGKPLGVLCHAPAALLSADRADGTWAFAGYRLTSFTNAEEEAVGLAAVAPWLLEDRLRAGGADFSSRGLWTPYLVSDRNLHTGQNPGSSAALAERLIAIVAGEEPPVLAEVEPLTGACLCGAVTYSAQSAPLVTAICHCDDCQRQSGSAYSLVVAVPRDSVELAGSSLASYATTTKATGTPSHRKFCSTCGSPLVVFPDAAPAMAFIKAGTLDDRKALKPTIEVHCASAFDFAKDADPDRSCFPADLPA